MDDILKKDGFDNERLLVVPESVQAQMKQHELIRQLYVTDIGFFPEARYHYRERPEGCESTIVICCVAGGGWFYTDERGRKTAGPGSLIVIPGSTPHTYGADGEKPWSIYWLHVQGEHTGSFLGETAFDMILSEETLDRWTNLFEECYRQTANGWTIPAMVYMSQTIRHMFAMIYRLKANLHTTAKQNRYIEQSIAYMKQMLDRRISLDDLASHTNVSKPHLITLFNRMAGCPPLEYFLRLKIQQACNYLDFTGWTVKEIGMKLGFEDPYYFSRQFRKIMGQSPTVYRSHKKG